MELLANLYWILVLLAPFVYIYYSSVRKRKEEAKAEQDNQRFYSELHELRRIPTSSTGVILGRRITSQIKMIAVDNHHDQDEAEFDFFSQVKGCGGNGVINMKVRRQQGGYVSIQGDAVILAQA
jgi:hypothetical protein